MKKIESHLVNTKYPVWDILNYDLSDLDINELTNVDYYTPHYKERMEYKKGSSKSLDEILSKIPNKDFFLDILYDENHREMVQPCWPMNRENFAERVNVFGSIYRDAPGFFMTNHIDNRFEVALMIINLVDNETSTEFHTHHYRHSGNENFHVGNTKRECGTMFLNTHDTPHSINHNGNEFRYLLFIYLTLK